MLSASNILFALLLVTSNISSARASSNEYLLENDNNSTTNSAARRRRSLFTSTTLPRRIKIVGEHNTGTNWLDQLVRDNVHKQHKAMGGICVPYNSCTKGYEADGFFALKKNWCSTLGWKHGMPPSEKELSSCNGRGTNKKLDECGDTAFIVLVKNPYAWFRSMYKLPYELIDNKHNAELESGKELETFMRTKIKVPLRAHDPNHKVYRSLIHLWNVKYAAWQQFSRKCSTFLRYEDLLRDPENSFKAALDSLGIKYGPTIKISKKTTKTRGQNFDTYAKYYLRKEWGNLYDEQPELLKWINSDGQLDLELAKQLGYEPYFTNTTK